MGGQFELRDKVSATTNQKIQVEVPALALSHGIGQLQGSHRASSSLVEGSVVCASLGNDVEHGDAGHHMFGLTQCQQQWRIQWHFDEPLPESQVGRSERGHERCHARSRECASDNSTPETPPET